MLASGLSTFHPILFNPSHSTLRAPHTRSLPRGGLREAPHRHNRRYLRRLEYA